MKELPLPRGLVAIVDDDVWEWASKYCWLVHRNGYVFRKFGRPDGRRGISLLRREIMQPLPGIEVSHRNGDHLDNRRDNLVGFTESERAAQRALRIQREGPRSNNSSGFRGVSRGCGKQSWNAKIRVAGKLRHLGCFPTPEAAARAWDSAARAIWGEMAFQNFPEADRRSDG